MDARRRLWAAGGYDGTLRVHDLATRGLLARMDVGQRPSCVNDIAFRANGAAYVTDSLIPALFLAQGEPIVLDRWVDLAAAGVPWAEGLNFNGIVLTSAVARSAAGASWSSTASSTRWAASLTCRLPLSPLPSRKPGEVMKLLAIGRLRDGADAHEIARYARAEMRALLQLYRGEGVREMYLPGRPGAVLVLEAAYPEEAEAALAGLPLVSAGLIVFEVIELRHLVPLRCCSPAGSPW